LSVKNRNGILFSSTKPSVGSHSASLFFKDFAPNA
jgi:hypothetical protein